MDGQKIILLNFFMEDSVDSIGIWKKKIVGICQKLLEFVKKVLKFVKSCLILPKSSCEIFLIFFLDMQDRE